MRSNSWSTVSKTGERKYRPPHTQQKFSNKLFNSKYLIPTKSASLHIRGTDVLRSIAIDCGAEHPKRLRSTKLRKHIATMTQLFNLPENEIDILAKILGHDIRVHREFYR
ncbi:hypothetical protein DPMN_190547 [Dreissena polymorpha]|uniref:Uncharacterized protein n=1 Tax=Dreissena polymorpha TaxID=45954 RepID=A0A9D4DV71_DREPO|nr:hypothetical protein DPMN_190547 [Dreissena polymorpha]